MITDSISSIELENSLYSKGLLSITLISNVSNSFFLFSSNSLVLSSKTVTFLPKLFKYIAAQKPDFPNPIM